LVLTIDLVRSLGGGFDDHVLPLALAR
jgi:hypothetical protein